MPATTALFAAVALTEEVNQGGAQHGGNGGLRRMARSGADVRTL
ncbi:protein of unknown function [Serratia sp. Tan611]|nr:protein of unknown function [Serratia sp. Tan611]